MDKRLRNNSSGKKIRQAIMELNVAKTDDPFTFKRLNVSKLKVSK